MTSLRKRWLSDSSDAGIFSECYHISANMKTRRTRTHKALVWRTHIGRRGQRYLGSDYHLLPLWTFQSRSCLSHRDIAVLPEAPDFALLVYVFHMELPPVFNEMTDPRETLVTFSDTVLSWTVDVSSFMYASHVPQDVCIASE